MASALGSPVVCVPKFPRYATAIAQNHWALRPLTSSDPHFVMTAVVNKKHTVQVAVNPTDSRGYRTIVALTDLSCPRAVLNRPFTLSEQTAVLQMLGVVSHCFSLTTGLVAQIEVAGNNAHSIDAETGLVSIGVGDEPSALHGHVICRGDPHHNYIGDLSLGGPPAGELFNMREGKRPWGSNEEKAQHNMAVVREWLRQQLIEMLALIGVGDDHCSHHITILE